MLSWLRARASRSRGGDACAEALRRIRAYHPPPGWDGELFQLPEPVILALADLIVRKRLDRVLELGTGFGATACVMALMFQTQGRGRVTTIDRAAHDPVNVRVLADACGVDPAHLDVVVEPSGYLWAMAGLLESMASDGRRHAFDLVFLDGAHEWDPDAGAFFLADRLLRPGGYLVLDDLGFRLADVSDAARRFPDRSPAQLEARQVRMVWDLLVRTHPDFHSFHELHGGRIGIARKR